MNKKAGCPPSQRQLRVGEEIRHALAWCLERGEVKDPVVAQGATVTEVRVTGDLRHARVYVTPLGGGDAEPLLAALKRAAPFLRHRVAEQMTLRFVPEMTFVADTSLDHAAHIDALLRTPAVRRDLESAPASEPDSGEDEEPPHGA